MRNGKQKVDSLAKLSRFEKVLLATWAGDEDYIVTSAGRLYIWSRYTGWRLVSTDAKVFVATMGEPPSGVDISETFL